MSIGISGSEAGLAISSALSIGGSLQRGVRQAVDTQNQMTCVERVIEYSQIPPEAPLNLTKGFRPKNRKT